MLLVEFELGFKVRLDVVRMNTSICIVLKSKVFFIIIKFIG